MSSPVATTRRLGHRARLLWWSLTSSLWFIPGTIVAGAVLLALLLVEASSRIDAATLARFPRVFGAGAAGSRGMLSTIAGSTITVAGVTFSITIAALAQASVQYTPRILRTFMADRSNQIVLGTFVGIFAYCLVVLRTIRGGDEGVFVPSVAVLGGFILALLGVGVLIYFIHHIAHALQASSILDHVRQATETAIAGLYPESLDDTDEDEAARAESHAAAAGVTWRPIAALRTGYVQGIDLDGLVALAVERGMRLRMERSVGAFVVAGAPLASAATAGGAGAGAAAGARDDAARAIGTLVTISAHRTVEQDAAFGIIQIVDIALKALSPGINDTTTAVTCIDHLSALLACLAGRRVAPRVRSDAMGPRVIPTGPAFADLVSLVFDDVRRSAEANVTALARLLDALDATEERVRNPARRRALGDQLERLGEAIERTVRAPADRVSLARRASETRRRLAAPTGMSDSPRAAGRTA